VVTPVLASLAFSTGGMLMKPSGECARLGSSIGIVACFVIGAILPTRAVDRGGLRGLVAINTG
jgi:hypothetical protein